MLLLIASGCPGEGMDTDTDTDPTGSNTTGATTAPTTGDGPTTTAGVELSHAVDIQPIWDANCVTACHETGGTAAAWFLLTDDVAYAELVDQASFSFPALTLVIPGDSANSYLVHKLNNTQADVLGGGMPMPQPAAMQPFVPLAAADIDKITSWIDQGAKP